MTNSTPSPKVQPRLFARSVPNGAPAVLATRRLIAAPAGGAKPIAPHFATRDAGHGGDGPPDTGPGEIGFHAPDERPIGLQIVAQCPADEAAGEVVNAAAEVGDRGPIRATPGGAAVDADIGTGPIIESHGGESRRRRK